MRCLVIVVVLLTNLIINSNAQSSWSDWQELYTDGTITISIKFKLINSCETESSQSNLYAYKITGKAKFSKKYLTYKSDFINCNDQLFYNERSVAIQDIAESGSLESLDFSFEAKELVSPFYDVEVSDYETYSSGVKAMPSSIEADRILGDTLVCTGSSTTLSIVGGSLGLKAQWVWTSDNCDGKQIGTGDRITITPNKKTTYFVKAIGELNETKCVKFTVSLSEYSLDPIEILSSKSNPVCEGQLITLTVSGGKLAKNAQWKWYENDCYTNLYKSGETIDYYASSTKNISVRAEGICINEKCTSKLVEVYATSKTPTSIIKPNNIVRNQKVSLQVSGGLLGKNAQWEWYKDACGNGKKLGVGPMITIKSGKLSTYYVKAKGLCNETDCIQTTITTTKAHGFDNLYSKRTKKFLNLGIGVGIEGVYKTDIADYSNNIHNTTRDAALISYNGIGVKGEFTFHPIIKPVFSLGFAGGYTYGLIPFAFPGESISDEAQTSNNNSSFSKIDVGSELCFGFRPVKFLFKANGIIQSNNIEISVKEGNVLETYKIDKENNKVSISGGIRLGRYARFRDNLPKRANNFDFFYSLSNYYPTTSIEYVKDDLKNITEWTQGAGFSWWRQSAFKFQFEIIFNKIETGSENNSGSRTYPFYQITFLYIKNWFY